MGLSSYGEKVIVEIPEAQASDEQTMLSVTAEKEVATNITANPDKYKSRFLQNIEEIRHREMEEVLEVVEDYVNEENTKEVTSSGDLRDGSSSMGLVMVLILLMSFFFMFMMMASI